MSASHLKAAKAIQTDKPASKKLDVKKATAKNLAFKNLVVLRNPSSTHAVRSAEMTAQLVELFGKRHSTIIDTEKRYEEFYRQLMAKPELLGPKTLLAIAGGDGTVSQAVNALLDEAPTGKPAGKSAGGWAGSTIKKADGKIGKKAARQAAAEVATATAMEMAMKLAKETTIVPLWGGNANDLAHMLNGPVTKADIKTVVTEGKIVELYPMRITYRQPMDRKPTSYLATNYISFGASAAAAKAINRKDHRKSRLHKLPGGRLVRELMTIIKAMVSAPRFRVREDGDTFRVYERALINGPRFAKVERVALDLLEPKFSMATVERKRTASLIYHGLLLANRNQRSEMTTNRAHFMVLDPVIAQIDGESLELLAKTQITVEVSDVPLRALSSRQNL